MTSGRSEDATTQMLLTEFYLRLHLHFNSEDFENMSVKRIRKFEILLNQYLKEVKNINDT